MNVRKMDKLIKHLDSCFEQSDSMIYHNDNMTNPHIDFLRYEPTEKYPFWKLITMGASDFKLDKKIQYVSVMNI